MGLGTYSSSAVAYFEHDGNANLRDVLRFVQRARRKRPELQNMKLVFMTGLGEGPVRATRVFRGQDAPRMIAVTFPPYIKTSDGQIQRMADEVVAYLRAMKVDIITARLPFDGLGGSSNGDQELLMIRRVLGRIGRSFPLCVQAVLQACDHGLLQEGESVIGITGDLAAIITASTTANFLSINSSFYVCEFICKPGKSSAGSPAVGKQTKTLLSAPK